MKNQPIPAFILAFAVMIGAAHAVPPPTNPAPQSSAKRDSARRGTNSNSAGAELFATHCGRCHQPPDDLSPRVVPAVLVHMRTRAMLSHHDEQELLKFLAPQ